MTAILSHQLPELGPNRELTLPDTVERTLPSGLTVIAIRRASVPLLEVRLRVPFAWADLANSTVLTQTMLSGTADKSIVQIAAELQSIGGGLAVGADPDRLLVSGNSLVSGAGRLLSILAEVLCGASYPDDEVATERSRLADRIRVAKSQPSHLARVALLKRIYPGHPYEIQTPEADEVLAVGSPALQELHRSRVQPAGATLVLVGDIDPETAIGTAEAALKSWTGDGGDRPLPGLPELVPGPLTLVDRPGAVQSSMRLALPAVPRSHADHPHLQLANLVYGGYFSSRWVENIREDKGYTYGPHSMLEHSVAGSTIVVGAEVATEVTAPALLETWYELGRLATLPPTVDEVAQARQYALGTLQLGMSTQAGLAGLASTYAGFGLRLDHLAGYARRLATATVDDVAAAAAKYLAPARAATVILGDADQVERSLATLGPLHRVSLE